MKVKRNKEKNNSGAEAVGKGIGYGGIIGLGAGSTLAAAGHSGIKTLVKDPNFIGGLMRQEGGKEAVEAYQKLAKTPKWKVAGKVGLKTGAAGALIGAGVAGVTHALKQKEHSEVSDDAAIAALGLGATGAASGVAYKGTSKKLKEKVAKDSEKAKERVLAEFRGRQNAAYERAEADAAKRWKISKWLDRKLHDGTTKEERIRNQEVNKNLARVNREIDAIKRAEEKALKGVKGKALKKAGKVGMIGTGVTGAIVGGKIAHDIYKKKHK